MRIFIAGATGVIGIRLVPLLVADGHVVAGMTRSAHKAKLLRKLAAEPVICDVFDLAALTHAVTAFGPEVVMHQLTDLPDDAADMASFGDRNDRMPARARATCSPLRRRPGPSASSRRASPGSCQRTGGQSPRSTSGRCCMQVG